VFASALEPSMTILYFFLRRGGEKGGEKGGKQKKEERKKGKDKTRAGRSPLQHVPLTVSFC